MLDIKHGSSGSRQGCRGCGARQALQLVGVLKRWPRLASLRLPHTDVYNQSLLEVTGACFLCGLTALDLSSSFVFDWCPSPPSAALTGHEHVQSVCRCKGVELLHVPPCSLQQYVGVLL